MTMRNSDEPPTATGATFAGRDSGRRTWWRDVLRSLRRPRNGESSLRDTLEELIERHEEDETPIDPVERVILENTLRLRRVTVEDVMVPRADIVAVESETSLADVVAVMGGTHHSRLPVYRKDLDDVIGIVHVKDVLPQVMQAAPPPLSQLVRPVLFVAPSMRVLDLLLQMREARNHMALVVDEYGGIDGLLTIENLVEEVVGEIEDEHEIVDQPEIVSRPDGTLVADARMTLEDFEERIGEVFTEDEREDVDTLGGLVVTLIGRVPARGELVIHSSGIEFEILDGDLRRLKRLRVRNLPPAPVDS